MAAESNENATSEAERNDTRIPIVDVSLWQIQQQYQQMMKQIQQQMETHTMFKKQCLLLKVNLLQKQLQLQKCDRLQWLLKCCGDQADDRCQYRVKRGSKLVDDPVAKEFAIVEPSIEGLPVPPRSWTNQPWKWCAAGYGGCCRHCPVIDASPMEIQQQKQQRAQKQQQEQQGDHQIEQDQVPQEQEMQAQETQALEPQQTQEQEQEEHQQQLQEQQVSGLDQEWEQGQEQEHGQEWEQEQEQEQGQEWEQEQEQQEQPHGNHEDGSSTGQLAVRNIVSNVDLDALQWNDISFFLQTSFY